MNEPGTILEEALSNEALKGERIRSTILAGVLTFVAFSFLALYLYSYEEYVHVFRTGAPVYSVMIFFALVVLYELSIRFVIGRRIVSHKNLPEWLRYVNTFVETSTPTLLLILLANTANPLTILIGPVALAYFLFIILSTLRLNFQLSLFTGTVAAFEYASVAFIYSDQFTDGASFPLLAARFHYAGKALMLFAGGIAAGFVGTQIKTRVLTSFQSLQERNEVVSMFGQQVSPEIMDELLKHRSGLESQKRYVCVMFLDIRNFTAFAEKREPEEVVAYQNAVFTLMIETVSRHHGTINQFLGDGFMATFGAPISHGNDSQNAVAAALEIISTIKQESESGNIPPTKVGIGLHAGEAVTGNVGSSLRKQFSVTGNVVILASRIEQLNKTFDSQLLISDEVRARSGMRPEEVIPLGAVQVKGRDEPLVLYKAA